MTDTNPAVDQAVAEAAVAELTESLKAGQSLKGLDEFLDQMRKEGAGATTATASPEATETVTIYHNQTGAPHVAPVYMLAKLLQRRFPHEDYIPRDLWDKPVFSQSPKVQYQPPTIMCMLNPEHPDHDKLAEWGVPASTVCPNYRAPSMLDFENHMAKKHTSVWRIVQREQAKAEAAATNARQDAQTEALTKVLEMLAAKK